MKAVLISIQPKWCELIANGKKTVEVRKTKPKIEPPFKCYIYCTLPPREELFTHGSIREYARELIRLQDGRIVNDYAMRLCCDIENRPCSKDNFLCKKVIGEFVCDEIKRGVLTVSEFVDSVNIGSKETYLTVDEIKAYLGMKYVDVKGQHDFYGWHISDLVIYDKPKELSEFTGLRKTKFGYEPIKQTRPPQSWCYVEAK